jgi:hypothetical protein
MLYFPISHCMPLVAVIKAADILKNKRTCNLPTMRDDAVCRSSNKSSIRGIGNEKRALWS